MRQILNGLIFVGLSFSFTAEAKTKCTIEESKKAVEEACDLIKKKGKKALPTIAKKRHCGANYTWIQDDKVNMVLHPIKPRLRGKSLLKSKDEKGKFLFVEFDKAAKKDKNGGTVSYVWAKPGEENATPKTSFVKVCEGPLKWIAGSGVWDK